MNILIVEPSKIFQLSLEGIFKDYATSFFACTSGSRALEIYESSPIDLICLSFYLSDIDGLELVSQIRKLKFGETIPILMITSKESQEAIAASLHGGVTEIFRKNRLSEIENYLKIYAEHARQQAHLSGNILVIDRDSLQVQEIITYFQDTKLKFIHFTNAEAAAEMARTAEFDLVITSVVLDGRMSGLALIREIRDINETMYRVPILAISAIAHVSQKIELLRAGASDYIQKPVLLEELRVRVKNLLHNKKLFDTVEYQRQQMAELAIRDQLTGLYNRHYLLDIVDRTIQEAYRYNYPISLLVIDIDHFKKVNDTYGHSTGDLVLKGLADLLMETFRGTDTPIRLGGEEFVVLLPHCSSQDAINRAQSLRLQIGELCPGGIRISASVGISVIPSDTNITYEQLFAAADEAVYAAKASGRNCVAFREPVDHTRSLELP
ncbi:diguanylate cyclase [Desulfopila sp. IMCC35008]|uniref:diguanylate cyclase n=1 Tax=Desulfopila sp. IMCC35008 TaxID=2653858 RepID=UPI0013D033E8|nr:diguanylate cyclase [Desulfopila sp. IMCC35008]